jgi:hypothetical protein
MIPLFQYGFAIGMLLIKSNERIPIVNVHAQRNEKSNQFGYFCKANFSIGNSAEPIRLFRLKVTSFTSKQSVDYDYREAAKKSGTQDGNSTFGTRIWTGRFFSASVVLPN